MIHTVWQGLLLTILLTLSTTAAALVIGLLIGSARLSRRRRWRWPAQAYILVHRHVPALVLMIFWAFALPGLFQPELRRALFFDNDWLAGLALLTGVLLPYYLLAAALGLTLNTSAYIAELFRTGVSTLPEQQLAVARTLGAGPWARFWLLLAPQGLRIAWPAISARLVHNMKNTALASFLAVPELFHVVQGRVNETFAVGAWLALAAAIYLGLAAVLTAGLRWAGAWLAGESAPLPPLPSRSGRRLSHAWSGLRQLAEERS